MKRLPQRVSFAVAALVVLAVCAGTPEPFAEEAGVSPSAAGPIHLQLHEIARFERSGFRVSRAAFSPDGRMLVLLTPRTGAGDWTLRTGDALLIETGTGRDLARHSRVVALSPDGRWLVTRGEDGTGRLIETAEPAAGSSIGRFFTIPYTGKPTAEFWAIAFSPDGRVLAVTTDENRPTNRVTLIDTTTRQEVGSLTHYRTYMALAVSPYGSRATDSSENLRVIETPNGNVLVSLGVANPSRTSTFSPDGGWLAAVNASASVGSMYDVWLRETASGELANKGCFSNSGPPEIA